MKIKLKSGKIVTATITTDHAASSYGIPVIVVRGEAWGIGDLQTRSLGFTADADELEALAEMGHPPVGSAQAAEILGLAIPTISNQCAAGKLRATKIGNSYIILLSDLAVYAREKRGRPGRKSLVKSHDAARQS